jgi:hypothetical protein
VIDWNYDRYENSSTKTRNADLTRYIAQAGREKCCGMCRWYVPEMLMGLSGVCVNNAPCGERAEVGIYEYCGDFELQPDKWKSVDSAPTPG